MNKILFPVDFSSHDPTVLQYASEIAYQFNAQLILLNSFLNINKSAGTQDSDFDERQTMDHLLYFINTYFPNDHREGVKIKLINKSDISMTELLHLLEKEKIDLIILGLINKSGSNLKATYEFLVKCKIPILFIPDSLPNDCVDRMLHVNLRQVSEYEDSSFFSYI